MNTMAGTGAKFVAAYIRRSSAQADRPGDASREYQQESTKRLAAVHFPGVHVVEFDEDWGVSGRNDDRKDYVRLKAAVRTGECIGVVAYSVSRLGRTSRELQSFYELCETRDPVVPVWTEADGQVAPVVGATAIYVRGILAQTAQLESDQARERSAKAMKVRADRDDVFGKAPIGYEFERGENKRLELVRIKHDEPDTLDMVLAAYREAGTFLGTCQLLTRRGVKTVRGHRNWSASVIRDIIEREIPAELPPERDAATRRRRGKSQTLFARLLVCHCGRLMTPHPTRGSYYCSRGSAMGAAAHGKYTIPETRVLPFAKAEAEKFQGWEPEAEHIDAARLATLELKKVQLLDLVDQGFTAAQIAPKAKKIDDEIARLQKAQGRAPLLRFVAGGVDFDRPAGEVNADLQQLWEGIRLDGDLNPVEVVWSIPAYYYDEDAIAEQEAEVERVGAAYLEAERVRLADEEALDATTGPRA